MTVGVFDSGKGGEVMAAELAAAFPEVKIICQTDIQHIPYGTKPTAEIYQLTKAGISKLTAKGANIIVLACNTASTIAARLREDFSEPIVALEPMVKPAAALTKTKTIAVLATPATLSSAKYKELKQRFAHGIDVLEPNCAHWSTMIQQGLVDWHEIETTIDQLLASKVDVIVLGCTHYHVLENRLLAYVGKRAVILQPSKAIQARVKALL